LLEKRFAARLDGDGLDYLHFISTAAQRMHSMIRDLLSYSRARQVPVEMQKVDLNDVVMTVMQNVSDAVAQTHAKLNFHVLGNVLGDPTRLTNLLQHLVINAMKFHRPDLPPHIEISDEIQDGWCVVTVADNGIGVPHQHRRSIFGLFTRLHNNSRIPGTGIGLAVCQRISEDLGGCIWVEDNPQGGASFKIRLRAA